MQDFLLLAFVFLIAGVVAVPLAARLGLGSVLGYLIAGIVLSPILRTLGVDVIEIQHFAEFGVVMMLFLVGLELEPRRLWQMRARLVGLGGLQIGLTAAAVAAASIALGQAWQTSVAIGLVLALSSTAIVLQSLAEKDLLKSDGGQGGFSVLLAQDIAVIPMLALLPLLALPGGGGHSGTGAEGDAGHSTGLSLIDGLAGWQAGLVTLAAIGFVIVVGSVLSRPLFRFIAMANLREMFTAAALMLVIGIALLMTLVGLSPALGTFLAGVVLANSEYRHELEADIDPFKGLLLGLFFITVGAGVDFALLGGNLGLVLGLAIALMMAKGVILYGLGVVFGLKGADRWLLALSLAQAGEFGFVLLAFTVGAGVIPSDLADLLLLVVAISMMLTPGLFIFFDRVIAPRMARPDGDTPDETPDTAPIIIAGHGRFGGVVNRMLRMAGHDTVVLDVSASQLEMLRAFGFKLFYGDATRPDLLHAAGIHAAKLLVVAIDDPDRALGLVQYVSQNHPHVHIVARARSRHDVYALYQAGCRDIIRETFDSSVRAGRSALEALGTHPFDAERLARDFELADRHALRDLAELYDPDIPSHENKPYVAKIKELTARQEAEMAGKVGVSVGRAHKDWTPPGVTDVEAEERKAKTALD